jgi:diguanylate cyclase (GGDEF)-like protein
MTYTALILGSTAPVRTIVAESLEATDLFARKLYCKDARRAIRWLRENAVDMICCDWRRDDRPQIEELLALLSRRPEWKDLPVVLFMPEDDRPLWVKGMELGVSDCLSRTLPLQEQRIKIRWHLKNRERIRSLHQTQSQLARMAMCDPLTGLYNRTYFNATLKQELARTARRGDPLSLLMIDLDHFKQINDTHGHLAGDRVLEAVAGVLTSECRTSDTVCRFGGEEFAVVLPETPGQHAVQVADRLRTKIAQLQIGVPVKASIGIGAAKGVKNLQADHLIAQADAALYEAKRRGRNRVELSMAGTGAVSDLALFRNLKAAMASA